MKRLIACMGMILCAACTQLAPERGAPALQEIVSRDVESALKREGAVLVDVRSSDERLVGTVPAAVEFLFGPVRWTSRAISAEEELRFVSAIQARFPDKRIPLILFCNVGVRSSAAGRVLIKHGYSAVIAVKDGYLGNHSGDGLQAQHF